MLGPAAGQYVLVSHKNGVIAAALYGVGIALFLLTVGVERCISARPTFAGSRIAITTVSDRVGLASISALAMLVSVATVTTSSTTGISLVAWALSLAMAVAAAAIPEQFSWLGGLSRWRVRWAWPRLTRELVLFAVIVLAGAALRLYNLEGYPSGVHGDEAEFGLIAQSILEGRGPNPFGVAFLGDPSMFLFVEAPFVALFGHTIFTIRLCSALAGVLTLPAFYILLRRLFGVRPALLGLALLAGSAVHINYSRMALNIPEVELLACLAIYSLWRGHRSSSRLWWFCAGVLAALSVYFYFAARILPVVLGAYLLYLMVSRREELRATLVGSGWVLLGGVMTLLPMGVVLASKPSDFTTHMTDRLIFSNWSHAAGGGGAGSVNPGAVLMEQFRVNLLGFVSIPDSGFYAFAASPILSPVLGSLFLLGLVLMLARIRDDRFALLALWFWPVLLVNGVITIDPPQSGRVLQAILPALAGVALVLEWALTLGEKLFSPRLSPLLLAAVALVPLAAGYVDDANFFGPAAEARPWEAGTMQARYVASLGPGYRVYGAGMPAIYINHSITKFLSPEVEAVNLHNPAAMLPLAAPPDEDVAFLVYPNMVGYLPMILSLYPGAEVEPQLGRGGQVVFMAVKVPRTEIARWQGLSARYDGDYRLETDAGALGGGAASYPTDAIWTGSLYAEQEGGYLFQLGGSGSDLLVDGVDLGKGGERLLSVGWHSLDVKGRLSAPESRVVLKWRPPGQQLASIAARWLDGRPIWGNLVGRVVDQAGQVVERRDRAIGFRNISDLSHGRRPATFSWDGTLKVPTSGRYDLTLNSAGDAEVRLDGESVVANRRNNSGMVATTSTLNLSAGDHPILIQYLWSQEVGVLELSWAMSGDRPVIIPPEAFGPPLR